MIKLAQEFPREIGDPNTWGIPNPMAFSDIPSFLNHGMGWLLGIVGFLAVIAVIYSGFMYITSGGDSGQAETAKKNFTWAVIGMVLVGLSAVITQVVNNVINGTAP